VIRKAALNLQFTEVMIDEITILVDVSDVEADKKNESQGRVFGKVQPFGYVYLEPGRQVAGSPHIFELEINKLKAHRRADLSGLGYVERRDGRLPWRKYELR